MFSTIAWALGALIAVTAPTVEAIALIPTDAAIVTSTRPGVEITAAAAALRHQSDTVSVTADATAAYVVVAPQITVVPLPPKPAPARSTKATPSSHSGSYTFAVKITGHQAALDRCAGFVWENFGLWGHVVSAHNVCGGKVILGMRVGDTVRLVGYGAGTYKVTGSKDVSKGAPASVLNGHLWMQTCYFGKPLMRLVLLTRVGG